MSGLSNSKVVHRGPKGSEMVNLDVSHHLGPFWARLDAFGPLETKNNLLLKSTSAKPYFVLMGQQIDFCLKWSKSVQMGSKGSNLSKTTRFTILDPFGFQGNLLPIRRDNR